MSVTVDLGFWPFVYMRLEGELTASDVHEMRAAYDRVFARGESFVSLSDIRHVLGVPGAVERKLVADWMRDIEPEMQAHCLGSSNLMRSSLVRGALTAIYWVFTPPVPQQHPARVADSVTWCLARLDEGDVDGSAAAARLAAHVERLDRQAGVLTAP